MAYVAYDIFKNLFTNTNHESGSFQLVFNAATKDYT